VVIGHADEDILLARVDVVKAGIPNAEGEYDLRQLQERLAKLTGGIAKLKVIGSSNGELKERRDRAEDAVCATRGAIKHGALIGGGWTLAKLAWELENVEVDATSKAIIYAVIEPSLLSALSTLFSNAGVTDDHTLDPLRNSAKTGKPEKAKVIDLRTGEVVDALKAGILDSVPALQEALKNSISIATLLGTLGGVVVFPRDREFEVKDARDASEYNRMINQNMANERP
jgi:chaperonin GroEL